RFDCDWSSDVCSSDLMESIPPHEWVRNSACRSEKSEGWAAKTISAKSRRRVRAPDVAVLRQIQLLNVCRSHRLARFVAQGAARGDRKSVVEGKGGDVG